MTNEQIFLVFAAFFLAVVVAVAHSRRRPQPGDGVSFGSAFGDAMRGMMGAVAVDRHLAIPHPRRGEPHAYPCADGRLRICELVSVKGAKAVVRHNGAPDGVFAKRSLSRLRPLES